MMLRNKRLPSLRPMVFLIVGVILTTFILVFFSIARDTMSRILLQAETNYIEDRLAVVEGNLHTYEDSLTRVTKSVAYWKQTLQFTKAERPTPPDNLQIGKLIPGNYRLDFIVLKDLENKDLHTEFSGSTAFPPGFAKSLNNLCTQTLEAYDPSAVEAAQNERTGILFHNGTPYVISIVPVALPGQEASGTLILGNLVNNDFFRSITHYENADFSLQNASDEAFINDSVIHRLSGDTLAVSMPMRDIRNNRVLLKLHVPRSLYLEGQHLIGHATISLIILVVVFIVLLYAFIVRLVLRPIETISLDIARLSDTDLLDTQKYTRSREFHSLGVSINEMLERLKQSNISLNVFQGILNNMDAYLYVSDSDTHEILFVNSKMKEHFGLEQDVVGEICWKVLQRGLDGPCSFCPMKQLRSNPTQAVQWEEHSSVTGRYYRNTDIMVRWADNKLAHLQHSIDITEVRSAQETLKRRLKQEHLMSTISQSFISAADVPSFIQGALEKIGQFLRADKIAVTCLNQSTLSYRYGWHSMDPEVPPLRAESSQFVPGHPLYNAFITRRESHVACSFPEKDPEFAFLAHFGLRSFLAMPIYVSGTLWGVVTVAYCKQFHSFSESDIHLMGLIVNVISGVVSRNAIERNLLLMSAIVESSPQFVFYLKEDGQFQYVNPDSAKLTGYSTEELLLGGMATLLSEAGLAQLRDEIMPLAHKQKRLMCELSFTRKDGTVRLLQCSMFTTDAPDLGLGAIAQDITETRKLEQDVIAAKDLAERSNHAKSDFLSRMSHEMRTPMNAIIGMTNIAKASSDPLRKTYCLDKIDGASKHLLGVINDILDMSKIEAGKFDLSFTDFNFEKMLIKVVSILNFRIDERSQNLIVNLDPNTPTALVTDEQRLSQVIANLLSNAVKFTPDHGRITLSSRLLEEQDGLCTLRVEVSDTGIGISPAQQSQLFHSFEQADGSISRRFGGTGLGLVISKNIVEMMGGSIWVESTEGNGASFIFTFKAQRGLSVARETLPSGALDWSGLRILAVDASPDVLHSFRVFAGSLGAHCSTAEHAAGALALLEGNDTPPFHMAFVDLNLPDMNGIALTKQLKHAEGANTVVVMVSTAEWSALEQDATAAGVDRFFPKPLFRSLLVDCIEQCIAPDLSSTAQPTRTEDSYAGCFTGHRILLAEDIEINREIVLSLLEYTGLHIDCAEDGQIACEMFARDASVYEMIFMDIHMPSVDGYEATRRIRAMEFKKAQTIPIVAMTANVFQEDIARCLDAGMNDHVGKPLDVQEILEVLRHYLHDDRPSPQTTPPV